MADYGSDIGEGLLTVEEFQRLPDEEGRMELVRGRVVREPPPGAEHGHVGLTLLLPLARYVGEHELGLVASLGTGFVVEEDPPTVRAPDVAFISKERIPEGGIPTGYWRLAPDLAVEVVSPSDTADAVEEKALDYLRCGVREVCVLQPRGRLVTVYRSPTDVETLTEGDVLMNEGLLPGFRIEVTGLFSG